MESCEVYKKWKKQRIFEKKKTEKFGFLQNLKKSGFLLVWKKEKKQGIFEEKKNRKIRFFAKLKKKRFFTFWGFSSNSLKNPMNSSFKIKLEIFFSFSLFLRRKTAKNRNSELESPSVPVPKRIMYFSRFFHFFLCETSKIVDSIDFFATL